MRGGALVAAIAVIAVIAAGCASRAPGSTTGASSGAAAGGTTSHPDGGAEGISAPRLPGIPADFRTSLTKVNGARFASVGHAPGRFEADVFANDAGQASLGTQLGEVPVGARLVEEHFERGGPNVGKSAGVMMIEKREKGFDPTRGDWRYVVVGSNGETLKDGVVESCSGCHSDAPHDRVFRLP